ncbi:hypothetical protein LMG3410_03591 [Achromobacter aegrifaciens]|nr:hypothetical protein LMG3410_03591 [Achromobacter aegrifaciens]
MHAADRHQMRDAAAVEQQPVLARDAGLIADGQGDHHWRIAMFPQGRAQTLPHAVARPLYRDARRRPGLVRQQPGLSAHRSHGPYPLREQAPFHIRPRWIQQAVRTPQHQRHAPDLAGLDFGNQRLRAGRRLPRDLNARGNAGWRGLIQFGQKALAALVAIRQAGHAQRQARHGVLMLIRQRIVQPGLGLQTGVQRTRTHAQHQGGKLARRTRPRAQAGNQPKQASPCQPPCGACAGQPRGHLDQSRASHERDAENSASDSDLPKPGSVGACIAARAWE